MTADKKPPKSRDDLIEWFTVSYRTIYIVAAVIVALAGSVGYYFYKKYAPPPPPDMTPVAVTTARFASLEGSVQVKRAGTLVWVNADPSMTLSKLDLVRTGSGAAAEIRFFNGDVFHVRPDSLITIEEGADNPATRSRQVSLMISSGEANFQTAPRNVPGATTTIRTPTVNTTAGEQSAGNIFVAEGGDTGIKVFRGQVGAETKAGQRIQLNQNEGIKITTEGKAGPKIVLPDVPVLLAPPHQAEIAYVDPARSTTLLAWRPVTAATYHIMLDYNPNFGRPVVDRKEWKSASMELRGLDVGTYYWKVSAVDKDGVEGSFSEFASFRVTKPTATASLAPPPPLTLEPLEARGNILQVKGRTEPGASLTVNGQRIDVASDGTFNEFITLEPGARPVVVIRATGLNGGVNEQKRPFVVSY
jgi:FecR protein